MTDYMARVAELERSSGWEIPDRLQEEMVRLAYTIYTSRPWSARDIAIASINCLVTQTVVPDPVDVAYLIFRHSPGHLLLECIQNAEEMETGMSTPFEVACGVFGLMVADEVERYMQSEEEIGGRVLIDHRPSDAKAHRHRMLEKSGLTEEDIYRRMQAQIQRRGLAPLLEKESDLTDSERRRTLAHLRREVVAGAILEKERGTDAI